MERTSGIYMIRNCANGKVYIGQSNNMHRRVNVHLNELRNGKHRNLHLQRAFSKYGELSFEFSVVEFCEKSILNDREKYWIAFYDSFHNGYNQTIGGDGNIGHTASEATRKKMSEKSKGRLAGKKNPMYGKSWKDYMTDEAIALHNSRISIALLKNPPVTKAVVCLNTGERFKSIKDAADTLGTTYSSVMNCCRGISTNCVIKVGAQKLVCAYEDEYLAMTLQDIASRIERGQIGTTGANNPNAKRIINITTQESFDCVKDAVETTGISQGAISSCLIGKNLSAGKSSNGTPYVWMYMNEFEQADKLSIMARIERAAGANKGGNKPNAKRVICVTTGQVFSNATEAASMFHIDTSSLIKCCKGKIRYCGKSNGEKLLWQYAS